MNEKKEDARAIVDLGLPRDVRRKETKLIGFLPLHLLKEAEIAEYACSEGDRKFTPNSNTGERGVKEDFDSHNQRSHRGLAELLGKAKI